MYKVAVMDVNRQTLRDALFRLDEAVRERQANPGNSLLRDAVILRFTFTFEAAVSVLGRYLESADGVSEAHRMSPRRRLREAATLGLIADGDAWMQHVDNRNRVVHAYSEPMADAIAAQAAAFAGHARALLSAMEQGLADGG